jgi:hypothetical protein
MIPLGRIARRHVDQAEAGQVVEIGLDAPGAQAEFGGNGGDARPTLARGAVCVPLQHGIDRDANRAHLGGVGVDHAIVEAKGVGAQRDDLCHGTFSFGIRSQMW